ncbi:substrate-binding domain-containing protein [Arboricoccus pini]|nr:substrate-binding domain-containing protein [Arboricoccus pini]
MNRRSLLLTAGIGTLALTKGAALAQATEVPQIAIVAKIGGIPWFNAMDAGIKKQAEALKVDAWMVGPTQADAAQQVRAVEDLIARKVNVIGVVPNDAAALEPVLARAKAAGIKVLTHESPDQKANDWDLELTTVAAYGEAHMDLLAKEMGEEGKYIVYVGSLTVPLHNAWADAAISYQKTKYPKMEMLGDRFGVAESLDDSFRTTQDQLRAHPDIKGILTFGSQGPIGAGKALDDRGKAKSVALVGGYSPGQGQKYVKQGIIRGGFIWNPMTAGECLVQVAKMLAEGKEPADGMELVEVGAVKVDKAKRLIQAQKLESLDKANIDRLVALGL